jgi:hypothetical protein
MQGIFFDETPNLYDPNKGEYLDIVNRSVKEAWGLHGSRTVSQFFLFSFLFSCLFIANCREAQDLLFPPGVRSRGIVPSRTGNWSIHGYEL